MKNIVIYTAELLLLAFVLSACSPIGSSDTASVSFTIDKNMAQHIADAVKKIPPPVHSREAESTAENDTVGLYVDIALKGDCTATKTIFVAEGNTAVFNDIPVRSRVYVGALAYKESDYYDRLKKAAYCDNPRPVIIDSDKLRSSDIPDGTDVIVAAHSHHFISARAREKVRYAVGYHPSLLPRHRGRDAVKWTVRFGDTVAGGTIYELSDKVDGGAIVLQRSVLVKREWTYKDLWREALFPLGVELVLETLRLIESGQYSATPQDESLATWEPPTDQNTRLFRLELVMIG